MTVAIAITHAMGIAPRSDGVLCSAVLACAAQFVGAKFLKWPLVAVMSLTKNGSYPHLALQAKREMTTADQEVLYWYGKLLQGSRY
jgi:hypothetical protein